MVHLESNFKDLLWCEGRHHYILRNGVSTGTVEWGLKYVREEH